MRKMYKCDIGFFDGDSWEDLIQRCLKDKYEEEHYQRFPSKVHGDYGLEGIARKTGKVFQCYCPEEQYETKTLTSKQKIKINDDLKKLIKNEKELKKILGENKISEWHLITPEYKDKSMVAYCKGKEDEYRSLKLDILADDFTVLIKEYTDYIIELKRHLQLLNLKLDISVSEDIEIDWSKCDSTHIQNLRGKLRYLIDLQSATDEEKDKKTEKLVEAFVKYYQRGIRAIDKLESLYPEQYERFERIKMMQGENVEEKCLLNMQDREELFQQVQSELLGALKEGLGDSFELSGIQQLSKRIVTEWLMLCPLNFGGML